MGGRYGDSNPVQRNRVRKGDWTLTIILERFAEGRAQSVGWSRGPECLNSRSSSFQPCWGSTGRPFLRFATQRPRVNIGYITRNNMVINCPHEFKDSQVCRFLRELFEQVEEPEVSINFNTLSFAAPYGTLLAAMGIREFVRARRQKNLTTLSQGLKSNSAITYLKHFSFFRFIGLEEGNQPDTGQGNKRYVPITTISAEDLDDYDGVVQERIVKKSEQLASIIFGREADVMKAEMLAYCIREVIRNVFEHSGAERCVIMAQKWANGFAEIAIADEGVGIYNTLSAVHDIDSVEGALRLAIQPGISKETAPDDERNRWQNSGFGLYVISELGRQYGDFAISSNSVIFHKFNQEEVVEEVPINGTLVKLKIRTDDAEYFPNILQNIVNEGEKLAKDIVGARTSASKQSRTT